VIVLTLEKVINRYVITSAQHNAPVYDNLMDGLENYCKINDAELIILPMRGKSIEEEEMAARVRIHNQISSYYKLNDKIRISNYEILPQQIDPITGLARFTQSDVSTVFASPKQRLKVVPNSNSKLPKVLMTTGAVTEPNYRDNRIGRIARKDHTPGAIVVETVGNTEYHFRQLSSLKNGVFYDLGERYDGLKDPETERLEALVIGDWHYGDVNKKVRTETFEMIKQYNPKRIILHDFFNGYSISHHEQRDIVALSRKKNKLSLDEELKLAAKELKKFVQIAGDDTEIIVVKSNHDEWIDRYLEEARFVKEPQNALVGSELFGEYICGKDPLFSGLNRHFNIPDNVKFLNRDQDYKIRGWQLGSHGDKGANGGRPGIRSIEHAHGKSITGHSHTPQIFRNAWVVGTSTDLNLEYNKGLSSWMNTHAFLYKNSRPQLINVIRGKHKA
jgi:hypothetical protein